MAPGMWISRRALFLPHFLSYQQYEPALLGRSSADLKKRTRPSCLLSNDSQLALDKCAQELEFDHLEAAEGLFPR